MTPKRAKNGQKENEEVNITSL